MGRTQLLKVERQNLDVKISKENMYFSKWNELILEIETKKKDGILFQGWYLVKIDSSWLYLVCNVVQDNWL